MKRLPVDVGLFALVDDEDHERLSQYTWHVKWRTQHHPYVYRYIKRPDGRYRASRLHREIMKPPRKLSVDHINGDCLDNRRCNLRLATQRQQAQNTHLHSFSGKSSQYKGVSKHGLVHRRYELQRPWRSRIRVNGRLINLGWYDTQEKAALAYNDAAKKYFGPFACLNSVEVVK